MLGNYFGRQSFYRTPVQAAQNLNISTLYADGPVNQASGNYSAAIEVARKADVVVYFGGIDTSIEAEDLDRKEITWPSSQLSLLSTLSTLGRPLVVVQLGTSLDNTPLLANANISAIIWAGYPGMNGGTAVLDILTGVKAPAGRLPIAQYPAKYAKQTNMTDMTLRPSADNPGRTYKWYNKAVQEFGFGLSYSDFSVTFGGDWNFEAVKSISIAEGCTAAHPDLCSFEQKVPVVVKNTGSAVSDYVVLMFMKSEAGPAPHPEKSLVEYERLRGVKPGEEREIEVELSVGNFARVLDNGNTVLYDGEYCLFWMGSLDGSDGEKKTFVEIAQEEIGDGKTVIDKWPQPPPAPLVNSTVVGKH